MPKFKVEVDFVGKKFYEIVSADEESASNHIQYLANRDGLTSAEIRLVQVVGIEEVPVKITHFEYLNKLRDSGITNMYGAAPYLMREFNLPVHEARDIVTEWMTEGQHHEQ